MSDPVFEFHISGRAREHYNFDEELFSIKGSVIFANFNAVHKFAQKFNAGKDADETAAASDIYGMGLLDEINHFLIETYRRQINKDVLLKLKNHLQKKTGTENFEMLVNEFASEFPSSDVFKKKIDTESYLAGSTEDLSNIEVVLEELIVLWLDNRNPAYKPIKEVIDEKLISADAVYKKTMKAVESFFDKQPPLFPGELGLIKMLRLPAEKYPNSITAQLEFIKERWGVHLSSLLSRILISLDFIREEQKARFDPGVFGPGPAHVIEFGPGEDDEPEQFSADLHWMPSLVLIAKSTYVWLDQLSKKYQREITRLDHIPDEELDRLAEYGFTGLWLIGLWERSKASAKIKQMAGNPEAVASAYSLYDYIIAYDLGGEEAYENLRDRAWKRGIRLASDMVPNHMAIDSRWVIEHPHWFIQSDFPPFPSYSFSGEDLSDDDRAGVVIEDGYWHRTDAAVVFKRVDKHTGQTRYIYHGNDGTTMPWNDTAQLNYLLPEVREAVIQTILHVARKFPVIRFDAAMTLAKKHYQRLWFPQPGTGGDIPSRAEHAMSKNLFDELFPKEFWREVVERVQQEAPDTLLLAEAFWMMESYFVRTLGMHRVYNSAFMNMLKNEENDKYKESIKNILKFNPQILKRYVNFMNNPDEDTAAAQFGKDDKYFGVCILMAAMPGLPMFGHGQIEGFSEKYGMEYRRAYWDEEVDEGLVERHKREIFPLLKKRPLFSEVDNFYLFDLYDGGGNINDNVFAFSNVLGNERALVVYNNKFEYASGWIHTSAPFTKHNQLETQPLLQALQLPDRVDDYIICSDSISGMEYIFSCAGISSHGLYLELGAFKYKVFLNIHVVQDSEEYPFAELEQHLNGSGVLSMNDALQERKYREILPVFKEAVNPGSLRWLHFGLKNNQINKDVFAEFKQKLENLVKASVDFEKLPAPSAKCMNGLAVDYKNILALPFIKRGAKNKTLLKAVSLFVQEMLPESDEKLTGWRILLALPFLKGLAAVYQQHEEYAANIRFLDDRYFAKILQDNLKLFSASDLQAERDTLLCRILLQLPEGLPLDDKKSWRLFWDQLLDVKEVRQFMGFNRFNNVLYFNKEAFEELFSWLFINTMLAQSAQKQFPQHKVNRLFRNMEKMFKAAGNSGYEWEKFAATFDAF